MIISLVRVYDSSDSPQRTDSLCFDQHLNELLIIINDSSSIKGSSVRSQYVRETETDRGRREQVHGGAPRQPEGEGAQKEGGHRQKGEGS